MLADLWPRTGAIKARPVKGRRGRRQVWQDTEAWERAAWPSEGETRTALRGQAGSIALGREAEHGEYEVGRTPRQSGEASASSLPGRVRTCDVHASKGESGVCRAAYTHNTRPWGQVGCPCDP